MQNNLAQNNTHAGRESAVTSPFPRLSSLIRQSILLKLQPSNYLFVLCSYIIFLLMKSSTHHPHENLSTLIRKVIYIGQRTSITWQRKTCKGFWAIVCRKRCDCETHENTIKTVNISVIQRRPPQTAGTIMSFKQGKHLVYFLDLHLR